MSPEELRNMAGELDSICELPLSALSEYFVKKAAAYLRQQADAPSALSEFNANGETDSLSPLERLRYFCSLSMPAQTGLIPNHSSTALSNPMTSNLIQRLRECLPTAADGPDHRTYCTVLGEDLRAAVEALSRQAEEVLI